MPVSEVTSSSFGKRPNFETPPQHENHCCHIARYMKAHMWTAGKYNDLLWYMMVDVDTIDCRLATNPQTQRNQYSPDYLYNVSRKKFRPLNSLQLCQILTDFYSFCTAGNHMKFATKPIRHYPFHLRHVPTLPWEIKNSNFLQIFSKLGRKCKITS